MEALKKTNRGMSKKSDRLKVQQHGTQTHTAASAVLTYIATFEQLFLTISGEYRVSTSAAPVARLKGRLSSPGARLCARGIAATTILVVKEEKSERKQKISHNHSIGMTIIGRNSLCGYKIAVFIPKATNRLYGETRRCRTQS